ncbi:MAG TPA: right-handed parallel beta-helix repeat-containing protein [Armatimonadota bacterium]|nr:right-handed parallel beta-helix repeat-containing protein [Armatimonadota bacterium]
MPTTFTLTDFAPAADGRTDDTPALIRCCTAAAEAGGGRIVIPPGAYSLAGTASIPIPSHTRVEAHGARFLLPERLGDRARIDAFTGVDVTDFHWRGGTFIGHCFDHRHPPNTWEPNATTRIFVVATSPGGATDTLSFAEVRGEQVAGAVITVQGVKATESEVRTYARNIAVRDCALRDCGKFMWDYGLLWQILVWPEDYAPDDVAMARRYFRADLIHGPVRMDDGDDRVFVDETFADDDLCFFGDDLPANLTRGRKYVVAERGRGWLRIAEAPGGAPITFAGSAGAETRLIANLSQAFYHLFWPTGTGPGKGAVDLVACRETSITGCNLSALGDTMHLQCCRNNVFGNNQITGSRMGAFFLAEYCQRSTVTGNTVDGANGSRVMSVEKSNEDVTIVGNIFRNGGRGSWINQPKNLVLAHNVFVNNTTKGERDPWRGRKSAYTGDYERWPELYFTTHEPGGAYGPVIIQGNVFHTGPECAEVIVFHGGGHDLLVQGNLVTGPAHTLRVEDGCETPVLAENRGLRTA